MSLGITESAVHMHIDGPLVTPSMWWNTLSNLQKAVRRGDLHQARLSAALLYRTDRIKLLRRLAVIALEDIGFGQLALVEHAVEYAATRRKAAPHTRDELSHILWLVERMVGSKKDRSACQLAVAAKRMDKDVRRIAALSPARCGSIYAHADQGMYLRCLAGRSLTGNLQLNQVRVGSADRKTLLRAVDAMGLTPRIARLIANAASLGGEVAGLAVSIPILHSQMKRAYRRCIAHELPGAEEIGGLLSMAYDKHTLEGKWALHAFATSCKPLVRLAERADVDPRKIVGSLVFMAEGSAVDRSVVANLSEELYSANEAAQCASVRLPYPLLGEAKEILLSNLESLNQHRRRVVEAGSHFESARLRVREVLLSHGGTK